MSAALSEQVLQVSGFPLSASHRCFKAVFLSPILLRLLVSTWLCPVTAEQQVQHWQVRAVDCTDFLSFERRLSDRQTDRTSHGWQSVRLCWRTDTSTCYTVSCVDQAQEWVGCLPYQRIAERRVRCRWWEESGIFSSVPVLSEYQVFSHFFQMSPFLVFFASSFLHQTLAVAHVVDSSSYSHSLFLSLVSVHQF